MSRRPTLDDLKKKAGLRIRIFLIFLIIWLFVDEFVKEGYLFSLDDVFQPLTHEFLIIVLVGLEIFISIWQKIKK